MLVFLLAQAAAPAAAPDAFAARAWGRFSRSPVLNRDSAVVEIASDGADGGMRQYQLRLTQARLGAPATVLWANSRTCPAVRPLLATLPALPAPRIAPPGIGPGPTEVIVDGVGYSLRMPTAAWGGTLTVTSNVGTPLAAWIDGALAKLARCWSPVELRVR